MADSLSLPPLLLFDDFDNDWEKYRTALYKKFLADIRHSKPEFLGRVISEKRHPEINGESATFWHIISEGKVERDRLPNFRRCERIPWPRPTIQGAANYPEILIWQKAHPQKNGGTEERIYLFVEAYRYLVILAERGSKLLLWTAFPIEYDSQIRKYTREYQESKRKIKAGGTP